MATNDGPSAGERSQFDKAVPDLVGEELGDNARIWLQYEQVARDDDRERIGNWNRGLDNLALFAGLLSAVTTTFIIESQHGSEPDYARLTFLVLNATASGLPFSQEPFVIDSNVRAVNCLWITSLMLSLAAALIAVVGKDWVGMYASRPGCNPRQWAEIRTYRLECINRWHMSGVLTSAPVLLHMSLILFFIGLVLFASPDPVLQRVALGLAIGIGSLDLTTMLSAIVFPTSPFQSPATRAVRSAITSISASLYDLLFRPKRPVALLQQATLILSAALAYPLPTEILPPGLFPRRRHGMGSIRVLWNCLFSRRAADQPRSWRDTAMLLAGASRSLLTVFTVSLPSLLRSAVDEYLYRGQRPRTRPWRSSALSFVRQIDLSDRWADVRSQPTPYLLAQSLSQLNAMTQSTEIFHSVLVALGDIAIGRQVAPLVSFDLKSRLVTEIGDNWRKVDLVTLSRFMLTDLHLSGTPTIPLQLCDRFTGSDQPIQSESIVFALVELQSADYVSPTTIAGYLPGVVVQPRGLQYLLPSMNNYPTAILLAERYWDHLSSDQFINVDKELHRLLVSWAWDNISEKLDRRSRGTEGLIQLLVSSIDYLTMESVTRTCALILRVLDGREYACVVHAFGHTDPSVADAAWAALSLLNTHDQWRLHRALPLDQFMARRWANGVRPPGSKQQCGVETCLVRTIARLLIPSRVVRDTVRLTSEGTHVSMLELCVRCLHTHLRHHRSALDEHDTSTIITLMLEKAVLIRVSALYKHIWNEETQSTAERDVINILTSIARWLAALLASGATDDYDTRAKLFSLFSFSQTTNYRGHAVAWDLGSYLRKVAGRLSTQDLGTRISMRRLVSVLRALRPQCAPRDDLHAAWERIGLAPDEDYQESFWDAENFELGPLMGSDEEIPSVDAASSHENTTLPAIPEELTALRWLDAAMR